LNMPSRVPVFKKLTPRMFIPVIAVLCAVGIGFYFFVLRALSEFAEKEIRASLTTTAKEIYDICDRNFTELMQNGQANDAKAIRIMRAYTLGAIDDYAKRRDLRLILYESGQRVLLALRTDTAEMAEIADLHSAAPASTLRLNDENRYFHHFDFKPWKWHFELVSGTDAYEPLIRRVKAVYLSTAGVLLLGLVIIILALERFLRSPLQRIIQAINEKRPPDYRGIHEFEFLSGNIAGMMISLKERTGWLERLYTIGKANRGQAFFDRIAETIAEAMALNTVISRIQASGQSFDIVAVAEAPGCRLRREYLAEGLPCDRIAPQPKPVVLLHGASDFFSTYKALSANAAQCYIGLTITNRNSRPIGCVHLFGATREVNDWDRNFIQTAARMAALEFELMEKDREQEKIREQMFNGQKLESLGLLAGGVAHDFNNLLMGIQGHSSLMLDDGGLPHSHIEHLKSIEEYVLRASELTRQLLGFARGGKYDVKPTDINAVLDQSARMFGRTKKEIRIENVLAPDLKPVEVDRRQIEQVFLNLFLNAWNAMPAGGKLTLITENIELDEDDVEPHGNTPGSYVKISVTDTGAGMDAATVQKIFDPFFTTREMGRGTGLGLATVYGIVKNHEGLITVQSRPGEGSTFSIFLPASAKGIAVEKKSEDQRLPGSETILLVDDEPMIVDVGKKMLARLGYRVLTAGSGREALELYAKNSEEIQLVIMDMIMPEMSGGETFERLKEIRADVRVLLSSGYSLDAQAQSILSRGCLGFIQKPFTMADLSREIRKIFDPPAPGVPAATGRS